MDPRSAWADCPTCIAAECDAWLPTTSRTTRARLRLGQRSQNVDGWIGRWSSGLFAEIAGSAGLDSRGRVMRLHCLPLLPLTLASPPPSHTPPNMDSSRGENISARQWDLGRAHMTGGLVWGFDYGRRDVAPDFRVHARHDASVPIGSHEEALASRGRRSQSLPHRTVSLARRASRAANRLVAPRGRSDAHSQGTLRSVGEMYAPRNWTSHSRSGTLSAERG